MHGENGDTPGSVDLCSAAVGTETYWVESIQRHIDIVTAAAEDPEAPLMTIWQHGSAGISGEGFDDIQKRSDFVAMGVQMVQIGESRANFSGWRTPK
jgi:hypothetical protein